MVTPSVAAPGDTNPSDATGVNVNVTGEKIVSPYSVRGWSGLRLPSIEGNFVSSKL